MLPKLALMLLLPLLQSLRKGRPPPHRQSLSSSTPRVLPRGRPHSTPLLHPRSAALLHPRSAALPHPLRWRQGRGDRPSHRHLCACHTPLTRLTRLLQRRNCHHHHIYPSRLPRLPRLPRLLLRPSLTLHLPSYRSLLLRLPQPRPLLPLQLPRLRLTIGQWWVCQWGGRVSWRAGGAGVVKRCH